MTRFHSSPEADKHQCVLKSNAMFTKLSIIIPTQYPEERLACFPSNFNYSCASRYVSRRSLPRDTFRPLCCALPAKLNKREGGKKGGVRALSNRDPAATAASLVTTYLLARTCTFSLYSRTFPKFPTPTSVNSDKLQIWWRAVEVIARSETLPARGVWLRRAVAGHSRHLTRR